MALKDNMKSIRKHKKISQKELANKCGLSFSMVSKLESGEQSNPTLETLERISKALGVEMYQLVGWDTIELKKEDEALQGLSAILSFVYDEVEWKLAPGGDSNSEDDYRVYLTKGEEEICMTQREFQILFNFTCTNVPNYIKVILSHE